MVENYYFTKPFNKKGFPLKNLIQYCKYKSLGMYVQNLNCYCNVHLKSVKLNYLLKICCELMSFHLEVVQFEDLSSLLGIDCLYDLGYRIKFKNLLVILSLGLMGNPFGGSYGLFDNAKILCGIEAWEYLMKVN
jgi:hypothetical protein